MEASAIGGAASAILIFMPGSPEIGRLLRALQASARLKRACPQGVRLLPLHGALSARDQVWLLSLHPVADLMDVLLTIGWLHGTELSTILSATDRAGEASAS